MAPTCKVTARYMRTSPGLRRFLAGVYFIEIDIEGDGVVEDFMFPDWATLRFIQETRAAANTRDGRSVVSSRFSASGPRTQAAYMGTRSLRQWGVLIHPVGWTLLVGQPADAYVNRLFDGMTNSAFAKFRPLAETLFGPEPDIEGELERLTSFFERIEPIPDPAVETIAAIYVASYDPEIHTVEQLAERGGVSRRTLERLCRRAFGFAPKLVLRRLRFLRSLTHFTMDPSLKWIGAMDASYHDQAQFVRDFHEFMGMTPTEYGQLAKPIIGPVIRERVRYARETVREVWASGPWRGKSFDL